MTREIHVFADWQQLGGARPMGLLRASQSHQTETFSFEYDRQWLASVIDVVQQWQLVANELGISRSEQLRMQRAFRSI